MLEALLTRRRVLQGSLALAATALAAPRLAWSQDAGVLKIRTDRDLQVLDPGWMVGSIEIDLQYACLGSLAVFTYDGETLGWKPSDFVESVEQVDPLHIAFKLKPGIRWSGDFGTLSSGDVKYSFERIADPANESPWKDKWRALDHVEVVDDLSGVIVLKEPFAPIFFTTLCDGPGTISCKQAVEAAGGRFTTSFPATCGPYVIKAWVPQQRIELALNPLWTGPKPDFEEVHFLIVVDTKSAELGFEAGDIDLTKVSEETFGQFKESPPADSKLFQGLGTSWCYMGMNTGHPKLQDRRVREAIQQAVDVDLIIQAAYGGLAARARGVVPPGLIGHRTTTAFERPDPDKARALLAEAGAAGLTLDLKVLSETQFLTAAQIIQANLADIGITVNIAPMDPGPFWGLGVESAGEDWKDLQLWIIEYADAPDPSQMTQWYVGSQVGVWNWERWRSDEYDRLDAAAVAETDPEKRAAMYLRMQDIMEAMASDVWIAFPAPNFVYRDSLAPVLLPPEHPYVAWFKKA